MQEKAYLQYRQVYDKQSELVQLRAALCYQDRRTMLRVLSALSFSLNFLLTNPSDEVQKEAIRRFFPPSLASAILKNDDIIFHRHQLLFLIQEVIRHCPDLDCARRDPQWVNELGQIFLMTNDQLSPPTSGSSSPDSEMLRVILDFVPICEANALTTPILKMGRSYLLVTKFAEARRGKPIFFDIPVLFHAATGVQLKSFQALMATVFTRLANVEQATKDVTQFGIPSAYFDQLPIAQSEISAFFRMISATPEEYATNLNASSPRPNDFRIIRDKPLVHIGEHYFPLDAPSGVEKFETGVFWSIFRSLPAKEEKNSFSSFWGYLFEDYGLWLLEQSCHPQLNHLHKNPRYIHDPDQEVCDAIIVCGGTAIFIEMKGSMIASEGKYGSDDMLRDEIEKKYIGTADERKGIRQLVAAIENVCSRGRMSAIQDVNLKSISTIIPILITRDDFGGYIGVNAYLNTRFKEIRGSVRNQMSVTSCICMCSDTLEKLTPYLSDTSFAEILSSRLRNDKTLRSPFLARVGSILKRKNKGGPDRQPSLLKEATFAFRDIAKEVFRGEQPPFSEPT